MASDLNERKISVLLPRATYERLARLGQFFPQERAAATRWGTGNPSAAIRALIDHADPEFLRQVAQQQQQKN